MADIRITALSAAASLDINADYIHIGQPTADKKLLLIDLKTGLNLNNVANIAWGDANAQTGTTYTIQAIDNGKVITASNASAITITIPDTLAAEFSCTVIQIGAGQVTFAGSGSMTLRNRQTHTKTAGQYAAASLYVYATNNVLLGGDTAA